MFYNFLKPAKVFEEALDSRDTSDAWLVAIVTAAVFAVAVFIVTADLISAAGAIISMMIQFYILVSIIYVLEFMMKNKKKKLIGRSFNDILSATGKLWLIPLLMGILLMIIIAISNEIILLLVTLAMSLLALFFIHNLYVLIKVALQAKTKRAIPALIFTLILHAMITTLILGIIGIFL